MKEGVKALGLRQMREARIQGRKAAHRAERAKAALVAATAPKLAPVPKPGRKRRI